MQFTYEAKLQSLALENEKLQLHLDELLGEKRRERLAQTTELIKRSQEQYGSMRETIESMKGELKEATEVLPALVVEPKVEPKQVPLSDLIAQEKERETVPKKKSISKPASRKVSLS